MKFSKKLEQQQAIPLFRGQWVTYRALKHLIKDLTRVESSVIVPEVYANQLWWFDSSQKTSLGSIPPERITFIQIVEYEINKTAQFYASQRKRITDMLFEIQRRIEGKFGLDCIMQDIDAIAAELAIFGRFIWQAKQLLLKITKKHDKCTKYKVNTWFLVRLEKEEFWNPKLDDLVIGLSETYAVARSLKEQQPAKEVERTFEKTTEDFVRKNEKFFIKPEDVLLVKLIIIRHLPLDVFEMQKLRKGNKNGVVSMDSISGIQDNTVINSIYLDNDMHTMYHDRTGLRGVKGNIIRIRWYGSHANPPSDCFVERKTKQVVSETEYYQIDEAVKERFRVNERNIGGYLSGTWAIDKKLQNMLHKKRISEKEAKDTLRKASAIQDEITTKTLVPTLRTVVRRSAFQRGGDQTLRFSLDTNLHIINEKVEMDNGKWTRNLNMPLRFDEVVTLPYAVLEVKTQADPPAWVDELKSSGYLIPAPHFSKFLYGTCKLWPEKVEFQPDWWPMLTELESTTPKTPALATIHERIAHLVTFPGASVISPAKQLLPPASAIDTEIITLTKKSKEEKAGGKAEGGKGAWNDSVVERVYGSRGSSSFLQRSMELRDPNASADPKDKKKKKKEDLVVTTIRSSKIVETLKAAEGSTQAKSDSFAISIPMPIPAPVPAKENNKKMEEFDLGGADVGKFGFDRTNCFGRRKDSSQKGGKKNLKQQAAEQRAAKVFFANERTMLSWLNTATFLSLTGVTLITTNTSIGRAAGIALCIVTILIALYALTTYLKRMLGLKTKQQTAGLADKYGPVALIALFCGTLILVAVYYGLGL